MGLLRRVIAALAIILPILATPAIAHADTASDEPTTFATGFTIAPVGTVTVGAGGMKMGGGAALQVTVTCPTAGTVIDLVVEVSQTWQGQTTVGFSDWGPAITPCSPSGTTYRMPLEVFTDIFFHPGVITVTTSSVIGTTRTDFPTGEHVILRRA